MSLATLCFQCFGTPLFLLRNENQEQQVQQQMFMLVGIIWKIISLKQLGLFVRFLFFLMIPNHLTSGSGSIQSVADPQMESEAAKNEYRIFIKSASDLCSIQVLHSHVLFYSLTSTGHSCSAT